MRHAKGISAGVLCTPLTKFDRLEGGQTEWYLGLKSLSHTYTECVGYAVIDTIRVKSLSRTFTECVGYAVIGTIRIKCDWGVGASSLLASCVA